MRALLHPMNAERLATLDRYQILDTDQDPDLNEIVQLAAEICETPIALISLVERDRQWFKAKVGLPMPETPIEQSICSHAILQRDVLEIEDTSADPRTADNPICRGEDPKRFYAGAPLIAGNGLPIGTLCVLDRRPRRLTDLQRKTLKVLAKQVMKQFDLTVALRNQEILQSEADHRVKNSLQSMSAIVRMHARRVTDPAAALALDSIQRRIDAVASLHLELQASGGDDTIDTAAYLERVVSLLMQTVPENISFQTQFDPMLLRSDQAANLAMIISEFVANSAKHAFPGRRPGEISIRLTAQEAGVHLLECADNGVGSKAEKSADQGGNGIGANLIAAAVSNLGGQSDADIGPKGSRLTVQFGQEQVHGRSLPA